MDRFFVRRDEWGEGEILLGGDEGHHGARVLRKKVGDVVEVFDGCGASARAEVLEVGRAEMRLRLGEKRVSEGLRPMVEVAVGVPKGKSFDLILQKAVELGVGRIWPLISDQGNVRYGASERAEKRAKWERVVLEACKQCGQNFLPVVEEAREVGDFLGEALVDGGVGFVGSLWGERRPFREWLVGLADLERAVVMIGPEGDFSEREYAAIFAAGFRAVDLGPLVLRTETAVFAMVASLRYQYLG